MRVFYGVHRSGSSYGVRILACGPSYCRLCLEAYSRTADARMKMRSDAGDPFHWIDDDPASEVGN